MPIDVAELAELVKGREFCFLVGAGASRNFPATKEVITAVLDTLLGKRARKSLYPQKDEDGNIRFEYLMQLLKDYCDDRLDFLRKLYTVPEDYIQDDRFTVYQKILAKLLLSHSDQLIVFTTNFDNSIEQSVEKSHLLVPFRPVFKDSGFKNALAAERLEGLIKLHGTVTDPDPSALGVTFESVRSSHPKRQVLEKGLRQGVLCVVGYSGGDDTDVVPVLTETVVREQPVIWFLYGEGEQTKPVYCYDEIDDVPAEYSKKNAVRIIEAMNRNNTRDPRLTFLVVGKTEPVFQKLIELTFNANILDQRPNNYECSIDCLKAIKEWACGLQPDRPLKSLLMGVQLAYTVERNIFTPKLAQRLLRLRNDKPWKSAVSLAAASFAYCDNEDYTEATKCARVGARIAENLLTGSATCETYTMAEPSGV